MRALKVYGARIMVRVAVAGLAAGAVAGCSGDMERFSSGLSDVTNSTTSSTALVPPTGIGGAGGGVRPLPSVAAVPVSPVVSSPLPAPSGNSYPRFAAPATPSPRVAAPVAVETVSTVSNIPTGTARNLARAGNWTPEGGTPIVVAKGESLSMLERRYGVPGSTLLKVNGMSSASQVAPGTRMVIPVYDASGKLSASKRVSKDTTASIPRAASTEKPKAVAVTAPTPRSRPAFANAAPAPLPVARPAAISRRTRTAALEKPVRGAASETRAERRARLKAESEASAAKRREAAKVAKAKKNEGSSKSDLADRKSVSQPKAEPRREKIARTNVRESDPQPVGSVENKAAPEAGSHVGNFRWPARGRIIQGYRKGQNDGINIAVPEGAPIKAAEGGVVAYAGNELKGYGNLVLIRHPNGYVSAYAHASQLKVKRGDKVARGQTIAAAGRTGNVATPQLHFELRKGADPVNPMKLLGSN